MIYRHSNHFQLIIILIKQYATVPIWHYFISRSRMCIARPRRSFWNWHRKYENSFECSIFFSILKSMLCPPMACHHWMLGPSQTLQPPLSGFVWVRDRRYWSLNDKFWTDDIPILFPNYIFWSNEENSFVAQHLKMLRYLPNVLRNAVLNNYMRYAYTLCTLVFEMDISTIYMVRQRHCGLLVWNYGELVIQPI